MSEKLVYTYWSNAVQDWFSLYAPQERPGGPVCHHYWVAYTVSEDMHSGFWIKNHFLTLDDWESLIEHWDLYAYKP